MEVSDGVVIQLELKYCERCGGLFLRQKGPGDVFCGSCVCRKAGLPSLRRPRRQTGLAMKLGARLKFKVHERPAEGGEPA